MTTYITLGSIGLIFNMIIFTQPQHRRVPCSLYISAIAFCRLIGMHMSLLPNVYALDHQNPLTTSFIFSQLQFYFVHLFNQSMRTLIVIACVDRYAICSKRPTIRSFSQYKIAIRIIPSVPLIWALVAVFPTMMRSFINGICDAKSGIFNILYSIYILIVLSIIPLISMLAFIILMIKSLKQTRIRVQPNFHANTSSHSGQILRKRDRDMMRMLLVELCCYVITKIPMTMALIYKSSTQSIMKSTERERIESFIYYFTRLFLLYMNNSLAFWIYLITSKSFRLEVKVLFIKWYNFLTRKHT